MKKEKQYLLCFAVILVIALFLRFFQLGNNPPSLDWDEASIGYNAYSILKTGADEYGNKLPLSFRSFDDYKPPVYIYLTVPAVALFGLNDFAVRLPAAIIGVIAVAALYFFTLEILRGWDEKTRQLVALTASFFFSVSPWHLQFSRAAFEGNIGLCFLILSLLFFFKGMKRGTYYFLFSIFFILSLYSYHSFRLINPLLLSSLLGIFYKTVVKQKIILGISLILICLAALPVYMSLLNPQGTGSRLSMVTVFSDSKLSQLSAEKVLEAKKNNDVVNEIIYNRRLVFIPSIIKGYFDHFNFDFLFLHGDSGVQHHAYNMGMLYLWEFPFIILGMIFLYKKRSRKILFLFLLFFLAPLPSAFTTGSPHPVRAIVMIATIHIFSAVGFVWCYEFFLKKKTSGKVLIGSIIVLFSVNFGYYLYTYFVQTPIHYGYFWQYGNKEAVLYAKQNEKLYDHIIMTYAYDQPYIYYLFHNAVDPAWYQENWNYSGNGTVDRFYRKIGKYEFMNIYEKKIFDPKTLLIVAPSEIPQGAGQTKEIIYFPDGRIAYKIVAL